MTLPSMLRIERPYASLDAYLEGDAWTVERTDMVLVGVAGVSPGATVKFEIVLANGTPAVVGEGRIVESVAASGERPAGTRIRFRQLDASSKALLRRALEVQKRAAAARSIASQVEPPTAPVVETKTADVPPATGPTVTTAGAAPATDASVELTSGVRHRVVNAVSVPGNREALLERLRERGGPRRGAAE